MIWDPYEAAAEAATGARMLTDGTGLVVQPPVLFLVEEIPDRAMPKAVDVVLEALNEADDWAKDNIDAVAEQLSPSVGLPAAGARGVAEARSPTASCRSATP